MVKKGQRITVKNVAVYNIYMSQETRNGYCCLIRDFIYLGSFELSYFKGFILIVQTGSSKVMCSSLTVFSLTLNAQVSRCGQRVYCYHPLCWL